MAQYYSVVPGEYIKGTYRTKFQIILKYFIILTYNKSLSVTGIWADVLESLNTHQKLSELNYFHFKGSNGLTGSSKK
jgi:hypothetical protein